MVGSKSASLYPVVGLSQIRIDRRASRGESLGDRLPVRWWHVGDERLRDREAGEANHSKISASRLARATTPRGLISLRSPARRNMVTERFYSFSFALGALGHARVDRGVGLLALRVRRTREFGIRVALGASRNHNPPCRRPGVRRRSRSFRGGILGGPPRAWFTIMSQCARPTLHGSAALVFAAGWRWLRGAGAPAPRLSMVA